MIDYKQTFLSWHISRAKSLKLHAATLASDHIAPLLKSPPQYRVAWSIPSPFESPFPQGQLTKACTPTLVSGHEIDMLRSCLPEYGGITVVVLGHPSDIEKIIYHYVR